MTTALLDRLEQDLQAATAKMRETWTVIKTMQDGAADGTFDPGDDAQWTAFDEAGKAYDSARVEVERIKGQRERALTLAAEDGRVDRFLFDPKARRGGDGAALWTPGQRYVQSDVYKGLQRSGRLGNDAVPVGTTDPVQIADTAELKALLYEGGSAGALVFPDYQPGVVELLRRQIRLLDLVPVIPTSSDVVDYVIQTSRTNAAAETAEASATNDGSGAAPESDAQFAPRTTNVRDITHFMAATKRTMADAAQLAGLIDTELRRGVQERLESQILSGNGVGVNLTGVLNTAGIGTHALGTDSRSDAIHKAITIERLAFVEPDALVLHPLDAESIFLEKDNQGRYIYSPPGGTEPTSVWGLRPIITPVIAQGTALVANFAMGCLLYLREGLAVSASDTHADFFIRRMVAMLAVLRAAFAVVRPAAFCTVTGL